MKKPTRFSLMAGVQHFIKKLPAPKTPLTIILGLSGGPDSVCLFHCLLPLHTAGTIILYAAHLNHGWRSNAQADLLFCQNLCATYNVPFIAGHATTYQASITFNGSKEDAGRQARRLFFKDVAEQKQASYIVLAHTKDDQQETFFLRLIRGATLYGLSGMKEFAPPYIRPLLNVSKSDILVYLAHHNFTFCIDETNESLAYLRNRIRTTLIPALSACDQRAYTKLSDTIQHLAAENDFLEDLTRQTYTSLFSLHQPSHTWRANRTAFINLHTIMQKRVLIYWLSLHGQSFNPSSGYLDEIIRFLQSPRGGKHQIGCHLNMHKKEGFFWLTTI